MHPSFLPFLAPFQTRGYQRYRWRGDDSSGLCVAEAGDECGPASDEHLGRSMVGPFDVE